MRAAALAIVFLVSAIVAGAQKTNDAIQKQIKDLHADKSITLTFDGNSSKVFASASNFSDADAKAAGVQAMNFGMAFFYAGQQLTAPPETINFTFWVLTKKPRFGPTGKWLATIGTDTLDLGEFRYNSKPAEDMEYLNFRLNRADLAKIASSASRVGFRLGPYGLTFTPEQMQLLRSFIEVSDNKNRK